jgi:hypothetical protein
MELKKMAKILKNSNIMPIANLGRFMAGTTIVVIGAFMIAAWAASVFASSQALLTGLMASWPVGIFGIGAVAAAGLWLADGMASGSGQVGEGQRGAVEMINQVMVDPQIAFIASRVK